MSQDNATVSAPIANLIAQRFDNGSLNFTIDPVKVEKAMLDNPALLTACWTLAIKTLIHKTKSRPLDGSDGTEWLISELAGGSQAGRFKLTDGDREKTASALKQFAMAPEQTKKLFKSLYGVEMTADENWLNQHYLNVRIAKAAAEKAAIL